MDKPIEIMLNSCIHSTCNCLARELFSSYLMNSYMRIMHASDLNISYVVYSFSMTL